MSRGVASRAAVAARAIKFWYLLVEHVSGQNCREAEVLSIDLMNHEELKGIWT